MGEAPHQRIARDLFEHRSLERMIGAQPGSGADHDPGHEADDEHDQDGDELPELHAGREVAVTGESSETMANSVFASSRRDSRSAGR